LPQPFAVRLEQLPEGGLLSSLGPAQQIRFVAHVIRHAWSPFVTRSGGNWGIGKGPMYQLSNEAAIKKCAGWCRAKRGPAGNVAADGPLVAIPVQQVKAVTLGGWGFRSGAGRARIGRKSWGEKTDADHPHSNYNRKRYLDSPYPTA